VTLGDVSRKGGSSTSARMAEYLLAKAESFSARFDISLRLKYCFPAEEYSVQLAIANNAIQALKNLVIKIITPHFISHIKPNPVFRNRNHLYA
jgi:hypothetical protein